MPGHYGENCTVMGFSEAQLSNVMLLYPSNGTVILECSFSRL